MAVDITSKFRGSGAKAYIKLGQLLLNEGAFPQAAQAYSKAFSALVVPSKSWKKYNSSEQEYIVNHNYKFIYCPIPKVACSSLKKVMVLLSDLPNKKAITKLPNDQFHALVYHSLTLSSLFDESEVTGFINSSQYFKFAFVRNPWSRLVSAYLNKFVQIPVEGGLYLPPDNAKEVIEAVYDKKVWKPNFQKSITFNQFASYVIAAEDALLDGHWKPQHYFLGKTEFDFIGKLENISDEFEVLRQKLNITIEIPWSNKTAKPKSIAIQETDSRSYSDMYPDQLRKLNCLPKYHQFFSDQLRDAVGDRYKEDVQRFNYEFLN